MGSSDSGGAGLADSGAGSIVWVRRRNGSWWPGKILGPDELSASHLMSPRSGTPVKLLGREDASVDWYNLEKSKRVKEFRCGEFDDCIERAEATLGLPAKKREKYARREDAILHALDLEKQFLEKKYGKLVASNSVREISLDSERKDLATSSGAVENGNGKLGHHDLYQLDNKVNSSNIMERNIPSHAQKSRDATHPTLQEHNTEASRQIRGLQEFKFRTAPVNRMINTSATSDGSNRMAIDGHADAYPVSANDQCFENPSDSDSRNSIGKGKRLLKGFVEESLPKRHDRHHVGSPLQLDADFISMYGKEQTGDGVHRSMYLSTEPSDIFYANHAPQGQFENSVSQREVCNSHNPHGTFAEESTSGSSEETESDSSETHSLEQNVDAGMMLSDAETRIRAQPSTLDRLEMQDGHESTSSDESDEPSLDDRSQFYPHGSSASGVRVSKWNLKGKRNTRNFSKRPTDTLSHRSYAEGRGRSLIQRMPSHSLSYYHDNDYINDVDLIEDDFNPHTRGFGKRGYLPSQAAAQRQNFVGQNMIDWEDLTWGRPFKGYWEDRGGCFNPTFIGRIGRDLLIDVDLKVQANRQGEHVPWVSLMSRLNGKAIIGHPIQIEALEDGSTDILVSTSDVYDIDRNRTPPVWRTARRTANFRVPRPRRSSQLDGDEDDADNQYFHQSGKVRSKKSHAPSSSRKGRLTKKTHSLVPRSRLQQEMKKPSRKVNPSSNHQKTKALSSIGYDHKYSYMDGVIKPVDSAVACIPVKLVFSRLLEAVGRPPLGPVRHGVLVNSNKERNPSLEAL